MIRYSVTEQELRASITLIDPKWLGLAEKRTQKFITAKKFSERSSIWSTVKEVYMDLQHMKCAYCERKLESKKRGGKIEQDVEHFRPKSSTSTWKIPQSLLDSGIKPTKIPPAPTGYYALPYHLFNYAAACKPCNSILKSDFFPIAGTYNFDILDSASGTSELPYLLYPIGDIDADPEDLIEFHGLSPMAKHSSGHNLDRALVTIQFFNLDDPSDPHGLFHGRSVIISGLFPILQRAMVDGGEALVLQKVKDLPLGMPHRNCANSFGRLFLADESKAKEIYEKAVTLVFSKS